MPSAFVTGAAVSTKPFVEITHAALADMCAACPVDDDPDPGEGAGKGDEQAHGADDDEGAVVGASRSGRRDQFGQGRSDHQGEQQRGGKRGEDLTRGVGAE